ncbi:DUF3761 domain-containing protein [Mycobacterium sp. E2733]|nr:DUF3761 domain-containing protein [Mycobacterium sp. E2733]
MCAADPAPAPPPPPPPPPGATAACKDGSFSFDKHIRYACQLHGGVVQRF